MGSKIAVFLGKMAAEAEKKPAKGRKSPHEVLDMDSPLGAIADYLSPNVLGGGRVGRAQALAGTSGQRPGFTVTHPIISDWLGTVAGSGMGGLAGLAMGKPEAIGVGTLLGGLAGSGITSGIRRDNMRRIVDNS